MNIFDLWRMKMKNDELHNDTTQYDFVLWPSFTPLNTLAEIRPGINHGDLFSILEGEKLLIFVYFGLISR